MREFTAVVVGALAGSAFAFAAVFLYIATIRRIGPKLFQTWRRVLLLPVHLLVAFTQAAPILFPLKWLQRLGASYAADDALFALLLVFGIVGLIPPSIYFYTQWSQLEAAGYLRNAKV